MFLVDGSWSEWGNWSTCSHTCGGGVRSRYCNCSDPVPQYGGDDCAGSEWDTDQCNTNPCPGERVMDIHVTQQLNRLREVMTSYVSHCVFQWRVGGASGRTGVCAA